MKLCYICNDSKDISVWEHPESRAEYIFCGYCRQTIIGVCGECSAVLTKLDPIGINREGKRICYKCSAAHDMDDDNE